jgi:hypothetical protein
MGCKFMIIIFLSSLLLLARPALAMKAAETQCATPAAYDFDANPGKASEHFEQLFTRAEQLRQAAAHDGAEWLATEALLSRSREVAATGNWSEANHLAQKACQQADLALQQAELEAQAWKDRVVD